MAFPKIKIIRDPETVYSEGQVVNGNDFIQDYIDCSTHEECIQEWLCNIPMPEAIEFVASAWGIEYEIIR